MVIRMTDSSNNNNKARRQQPQQPSQQHQRQQQQQHSNPQLRRTKMTRTAPQIRNTRAEFKRLKTILPTIRRKENVSKLDIILEAIKYIDDLQDQLFDRLSGTHSQRKATLMALTEQDMEKSRARLSESASSTEELMILSEEELADHEAAEDEILDDTASDEDDHSHASLELWILLALVYTVQTNVLMINFSHGWPDDEDVMFKKKIPHIKLFFVKLFLW